LIASIIKKDSLVDALNFMEKYHLLRDKVEYDSQYHDGILKALHGKMKEKYGNVETLDGLKVIIDEDSWALVRRSNTENAIRISAESNSLEIVRNIHLEIKDLIKQSYEQIK
jgi:phosphomannomutase